MDKNTYKFRAKTIFMTQLFVFIIWAQELIRIERYDASTYFVSDALPMKTNIIGNPLDYAGKRIGLDVRSVELPRGYEGNYRFACRFPIIDYVSNRPLYLKQWAEDNSALITKAHQNNGIKAISQAIEILRGTADFPKFTTQMDKNVLNAFKKGLSKSNFTGKYRKELIKLYQSYLTAFDLSQQAKKNLTKEDLDFFNANPAYFLIPDGKKIVELTGNITTQFEFIERARRVGYEYIFYAAEILSGAINDYVTATKEFKTKDYFTNLNKSNEVIEISTPIGLAIISGLGNDTLNREANFVIDLGGDDIYLNNAGGCKSSNFGIAISIDHNGNDQYLAPEQNFVHGFGFLGCGFLVDLAGNDKYVAKHFSQGAGIMGVGVIWDNKGNDIYDAHGFCQGIGMFGLGLILESSGNDLYDCATLGQGAATTLGLGIVSDLYGYDQYRLAIDDKKDAFGRAPGFGQGGALSFRHYPWERKLTAYGGVGMLVDENGDDQYQTKGWCDQGGSYIMSLGVLVDNNGNDQYSASTGQGSGIHITNAILIDKAGNDIYEGGFRSGGSGGDRSTGFLIDYQGSDIYKSKTSSYGTGCKPFSFSLFIDYQGDDKYICSEPKVKITFNNWESFGGIWPESEAHLWPYAIALDLNGNDDYQVRHRENNSERHSFGHGIHLDTEWQGGDVIGKVECPLPPYFDFPLPDTVRKSKYYADIKLLQNPDNFIRFQAIGRIKNASAEIVPMLVEAIVKSSHRQFNRDVMECLHYFFVNDKITEKELVYLFKLLKASDVEVRTIMADNFGVWKFNQAEDSLIIALKDSEASVRRFAIRSLMAIKSSKALTIAPDFAINDPSEDVRRLATYYLSRVKGQLEPYPYLIQILESDTMPSVRVAAIEGLGYIQNPDAIPLLQKAAKSNDVYVNRACGKTLAELYQIEGVEILIKSLSFPSIDAFYNYDRNIPNFLAAYTNFDFSEDERYDQTRWQNWFEKNKNKINLSKNVVAYRAFTELNDSLRNKSDEEKIQKFEELLKKFPYYQSIRKALARKLNEVAWNMVTAAKGTKDYNPETGLKYARRATELVPDRNYFDTLAEALLANGKIEESLKLCQEMLKKYPNENMFLERIKKLQK